MTDEQYDIELGGCAPVPLAHYLKAIGVLRLVAEQVDPVARGYWGDSSFHLISSLDRRALMAFFLDSYRPTPVIAPWNGGSGFFPGDNHRAINKLREWKSSRMERYQNAISSAFTIKDRLNIAGKPDKELKEILLDSCRANLPDEALSWTDAAFVMTEDGAKYPPLLGTGGNDGRLDFTNNFMQRLCDVLIDEIASSTSWIEGALFGATLDNLQKGSAIGQFLPSAAGGANAEAGFDADSLVNPWDYILMIEGVLLFAASSVRRLERSGPGALSYPFSVRQSGVGYGSASLGDEKEARAEMWLPLWTRKASIPELRALMSEGKARVGKRVARNGVDFARAIAALGVDRGLSSFQRYGFQIRNGLAYFAIPLGRFAVRRQPQADLLFDIDSWLDTFQQKATMENAPASLGRTLRGLEEAILVLCKEKGTKHIQDVLISLGECERNLDRSKKWADEKYIQPIPQLSGRWLHEADDGSPEFRLAASLASVYGQYKDRKGKTIYMCVRAQMEQVTTWIKEGHLMIGWNDEKSADVVWHEGNPIRAMNDMMARRIMRAVQSGATTYPDRGTIPAELGDIADFIEGRVDLERMSALLCGLILLDWPAVPRGYLRRMSYADASFPDSVYGLLKLCYPGGRVREQTIPLVPEIQRRASSGDCRAATTLAARRLRGCGLVPSIDEAGLSRERTQRAAAALLFPLDDYQLNLLAERVLRPEEEAKER